VLHILKMSFVHDLCGNYEPERIVDELFGGDAEISSEKMESLFMADPKLLALADVIIS
jgi:hypothetical protein